MSWSFLDYRYRLVKAIQALEQMANDMPPLEAYERARILHKAEGVKLALSYFDEMTKERGFTE